MSVTTARDGQEGLRLASSQGRWVLLATVLGSAIGYRAQRDDAYRRARAAGRGRRSWSAPALPCSLGSRHPATISRKCCPQSWSSASASRSPWRPSPPPSSALPAGAPRQFGVTLALAAAQQIVARVLSLTALDQHFPVYATVAEALADGRASKGDGTPAIELREDLAPDRVLRRVLSTGVSGLGRVGACATGPGATR